MPYVSVVRQVIHLGFTVHARCESRLSTTNYNLGRIAGLRLTARPSAGLGALLLWALLSAIGASLLGLPPLAAIGGGLAAMLLHWLSSLAHHLGHAAAARGTGYPMLGVRFWGVLGTSIYPRDEPPLPAGVHIRRALGGPIASAALTLVAGALALLTTGQAAAWVARFFFLENLLVYTLQVVLPLGFNDGATILHWWRKSRVPRAES